MADIESTIQTTVKNCFATVETTIPYLISTEVDAAVTRGNDVLSEDLAVIHHIKTALDTAHINHNVLMESVTELSAHQNVISRDLSKQLFGRKDDSDISEITSIIRCMQTKLEENNAFV